MHPSWRRKTGRVLAEHRIIEDDAEIGAIASRWDKIVPTGRVRLEVRTSTSPAHRMGAETRRKIAAGNAKREITTAESA